MQSNNGPRTVLLDVGGTGIKGCISREGSDVMEMYREFPAKSDGNSEAVFNNFSDIIKALGGGGPVSGIGFAFPGPFDYSRGISLMRGIGKYDSIYGMPIRDELVKRDARLKSARMIFVHDTEAFALGCVCAYPNARHRKMMCLCIGTGAGSAFLRDGAVLKREEYGAPPKGWIYSLPFRDSIIDDYVSGRGLETAAEEMLGEKLSGKELSKRAEKGEKGALSVYRNFGETIAEAIRPVLASFHPDLLMLGGKIAKGYPYFGNPLKALCSENQIMIEVETDTSAMTMKGLNSRFSGEAGGRPNGTEQRGRGETTVFAAGRDHPE